MSRQRRLRLLAVLCCALGPPMSVSAGPDWEELVDGGGDAGDLKETAQVVAGMGSLNTITGALDGQGLFAGDFQDVFLIRIDAPTAFIASTSTMGGAADFDTQLWLFEFSGLGLLGNDDVSLGNPLSELRSSATDGSGASISVDGLYYLAISGFDSDPVSLTGPIFDQVLPTEISGPDGPGGSMPLSGWDADGLTGEYVIALSGAEFVETCPGDLNYDGVVDSADLALMLGIWGPCGGCPGDLDGDGLINATDLALLLGNWGVCFPV